MLDGRSESLVSCACVCRLSTSGTHVVWPARCKQAVLLATEYPAVVRTFDRQRPIFGGRNENDNVPFWPLCTLRKRLPALTRSDDERVTSNTVKTPPIQVIEADGVTFRSTVLFNATLVGPPNVGCSFTDSVRR